MNVHNLITYEQKFLINEKINFLGSLCCAVVTNYWVLSTGQFEAETTGFGFRTGNFRDNLSMGRDVVDEKYQHCKYRDVNCIAAANQARGAGWENSVVYRLSIIFPPPRLHTLVQILYFTDTLCMGTTESAVYIMSCMWPGYCRQYLSLSAESRFWHKFSISLVQDAKCTVTVQE